MRYLLPLLLVAVSSGCIVDNDTYSPLAQVIAERDGFDPFAVAPDMLLTFEDVDLATAWRPDLTGGQCVEPCGVCSVNQDCCAGHGGLSCYFGKCATGGYANESDGGIVYSWAGCD